MKTLKIKGFDSPQLLPIITGNCKQLESFVLKYNRLQQDETTLLTGLLTLTNLTELKIDCNTQNVTQFIQGINSLKSLNVLEFMSAKGDADTIPALSQLTQLRVLKLKYCYNLKNLNPLGNLLQLKKLTIVNYEEEDLVFDILDMITRLVNLKELTFQVEQFEMDKRTYLLIVGAISWRLHYGQPLRMSCYFKDISQIPCHGDNRRILKIKTEDD